MANISGLVTAHKGVAAKRINSKQTRATYRDLEQANPPSDDTLMSISPMGRTTTLQMEILETVARGLGIPMNPQPSTDQRDTWMIGAWTLDTGVSISIWMMAPNISTCTVDVDSSQVVPLGEIANMLNKLSIPESKCFHKIHHGSYQYMGRLVPEMCQIAADHNIAHFKMSNLCFVNIGGSKLSMWVKIGSKHHLCHITRNSARILMRYLPAGFGYSEEHSRMNGICIRRVTRTSNLTQLLLGTSGVVQYNGAPSLVEPLYQALGASIRAMMEKGGAGAFISTLHVAETLSSD